MRQLILLLCSSVVFGQNIPVDSVSYDYFYKKEMQTIVQLKKEVKNEKFDALKQLKIAELYANINCEDSAYATYYNVFEKERINKTLNEEEYKELLFQLHRTESSKHNYSKDRRFFLNQLKIRSENDRSDKWFAKIENQRFGDIYVDSSKYQLAFEKLKLIQKTNFYKTNTEFQATILLNLGNVFTSLKEFDLSKQALLQSLQLSIKNKDDLGRVYALINLGVNERVRGNYEKALSFLNQTDAIPIEKYRIKISRIVAFQKLLVYEGLNDTVAAKKQEKLYTKLDSLINDFAINSNFYEIDVKYLTKEKDAKIVEFSDLEDRFLRNKILYGFLILVTFILALYSFIRWKKVDKSKRILALEKEKVEQESIETKVELETVKKKSIIEHIVLKNKSIVHLDDLLYIRSDDHYLELITTVKKETTRGSLKEIEDQLPPNFFRCHKSYIVNSNFVKTNTIKGIVMQNNDFVPTSRKYREL